MISTSYTFLPNRCTKNDWVAILDLRILWQAKGRDGVKSLNSFFINIFCIGLSSYFLKERLFLGMQKYGSVAYKSYLPLVLFLDFQISDFFVFWNKKAS